MVQLDDPALTYFCDRQLMAGAPSHDERLRRDWDADRQFPQALAAINRVAEGLRAEVHLHCCHSVSRRKSDVQLLPAHLGLGMGVVDVRRERVPSVEEIEVLGAAGARIVSPERMALNP